jgi:hypothetical protein
MNAPTLRAHRTGLPSGYEIVLTDAPASRISARTVQHGGELELDGHRYTLTSSAFGRSYRLDSADGEPIAAAQRVGRRGWNVEAGAHSYRFARDSIGSGDQVLVEGDTQVGHVRRSGWSSRTIEADLPDLDRPVAVFVLILTLAMGQRRRRAVIIGR